MKSILADPEYPYFQSGLLLTPPNPAFQSQFARLVAGNRFYPNINCQIELDLSPFLKLFQFDLIVQKGKTLVNLPKNDRKIYSYW